MKHFILLLPAVIMLFTACNQMYYTPNTQNVPLITKPGEANINVSGHRYQANFQGSLGVTRHISVQAQGVINHKTDIPDHYFKEAGRFFEFGIGYNTKLSQNFVFESYGLYGFGNFHNTYSKDYNLLGRSSHGTLSASFKRFGFQPAIGFKQDLFYAALSARYLIITYHSIDGDLKIAGISQARYLNNRKNMSLFEPAITIRSGSKHVQVHTQVGRSFNLSDKNFRQQNNFYTVGINFHF